MGLLSPTTKKPGLSSNAIPAYTPLLKPGETAFAQPEAPRMSAGLLANSFSTGMARSTPQTVAEKPNVFTPFVSPLLEGPAERVSSIVQSVKQRSFQPLAQSLQTQFAERGTEYKDKEGNVTFSMPLVAEQLAGAFAGHTSGEISVRPKATIHPVETPLPDIHPDDLYTLQRFVDSVRLNAKEFAKEHPNNPIFKAQEHFDAEALAQQFNVSTKNAKKMADKFTAILDGSKNVPDTVVKQEKGLLSETPTQSKPVSVSSPNTTMALEARKYKTAEELMLPTPKTGQNKVGQTLSQVKLGSETQYVDTPAIPLEGILNKAKASAESGADMKVGNYFPDQFKVKDGVVTVYHGTSPEVASKLDGNAWKNLNDGSYVSLTSSAQKEASGVYGAKFYADQIPNGEVVKLQIPIKNLAIDKATGELRYTSQLTDIYNKAKSVTSTKVNAHAREGTSGVKEFFRNVSTKGKRGFVKNPFAEDATAPASRERGFVSSVKKELPQVTKVAGQYIPRDTDALAIKAKNLIKDDLSAAQRLATTGTDDKAVATAAELVKHLSQEAQAATSEATKNALYDQAAHVANTVAVKLTESGRTVQAASILGRLTPEGQLRFAAREIQRYNEEVAKSGGGMLGLKKQIPELTGEQAKDILERSRVVQKMPDGWEKARAFRDLQDHMVSLVPTSLYKKLVAVWKAGLLTGIKTSGLNTASNLFHGISEVAKDLPTAAVDSVASLFTGKRTAILTAHGSASGIKEGFAKGWRYLRTGYDVRDIGTKLDIKKVNFGNGRFAKAIQAYEEGVFRVIGAEDQPFYYGAKARSLTSQALAEVKNQGLKGKEAKQFVTELVQNPTDEMLRYATIDAETAVFQNSTVLAKIAKKIQDAPGGEIIIPFAKTPAAVATQLVNYSPVGVVKTLAENIGKGKFDQRLFSQGIGRAITGTATMYLGTKLFEKGMLTLTSPKTEAEQKQWELEGKKQNSILVDGKWRSVNVFGPLGMTLLVGGYFQQGIKDTGSIFGALTQAAAGGGKTLTDQTFLRGVDQLVKAISDPVNYGNTYFKGLIGSVIPTIVSDVARSTDSVERRTPGMLDTLKSRVPGVRGNLQPQVDTLGNNVETPGFATAMADPTRPGTEKHSPLIDELRRLSDAGYQATPSQVGDKNGYDVLSPEQNTELWQRSGQLTEVKLNSLLNHPEYQKLDDEKKAKAIASISDKAKTYARAEVVLHLTEGMKGDELKQELSRLKAGKLLTQDVFDAYLELR